jgi:hypothetical protein
VREGGVVTGFDEGVLWFQGALLRFEGKSTSFALAPRPYKVDDRGVFQSWTVARYAIDLACPCGGFTVVVRAPRFYVAGGARQAENKLDEELGKWSRSATDPNMEEVLPPLKLQPEVAWATRLRAHIPLMCLLLAIFETDAFVSVMNRRVAEGRQGIAACVPLAGLGALAAVLWALIVVIRRRYRRAFPDDPVWSSPVPPL